MHPVDAAEVVSAVIGLAILTFAAISTLAAYTLTTPRRHPLAEGKTPGDLGVAFEEVRFAAHGDGLEIAGWFIPSGGSRRAIVLVHGKDANRRKELDRDLSDAVPVDFPHLAGPLHRTRSPGRQ